MREMHLVDSMKKMDEFDSFFPSLKDNGIFLARLNYISASFVHPMEAQLLAQQYLLLTTTTTAFLASLDRHILPIV